MINVYYFFIYSFIGWIVEVGYATLKTGKFSNRGFLNGPICPIYGFGMLLILNIINKFSTNFLDIFLISALFATFVEFIAGFILEKVFNNKWWDYSEEPFNIKGYACLSFSIKWGIGGLIVVAFFHPVIQNLYNLMDNVFGVIILIVLIIYLLSDFCITVNTVLKLNKKMERMSKNAEKLKELSNFIGENVYEKILILIETGEDIKIEIDKKHDDLKCKIDEFNAMKNEYISDFKSREFGVKGLFGRHPNLKNNINNELLQKHKEHILKSKKKKNK